MSTDAEELRVAASVPRPAPAPEDADADPPDAGATESQHRDCPYCGDTGRKQQRKYRFCGHDTA